MTPLDREQEQQRKTMLEQQIASRGVRDQAVLQAIGAVPRHHFVPEKMQEYAYVDSPLPIGEEQTISQPYIVALMTEALELEPGARVLEIGTGSGYAAAVLAEVADEVYTVERHGTLAEATREQLHDLGYDNVHVRHGDGSLGWPEHAPYDGIIVAAGGPEVPQPLKEQLAIGGRLVMPVGRIPRMQKLLVVQRISEEEYETDDMGYVQFVPLVGQAAWEEKEAGAGPAAAAPQQRPLPDLISAGAEPIESVEEADLEGLLERIGDAHVVLLGEATHGTAEFYDMRARITQALIEQKGFNIVAVEADWPDATRVDQYVRDTAVEEATERPFSRFPTWMWANTAVLQFIEWLRRYNQRYDDHLQQIGFYGLDLYSMYSSIQAVLNYLEDVDPDTAQVARQRYGCLTPWESDPSAYGAAAITGQYQKCEAQVLTTLQELLEKSIQYTLRSGERFFNAAMNARLVANAERYYRVMYYGSPHSWNLRDQHMFDTLEALLAYRGPDSKAVVWAHNSHLGNAEATEMGARGQWNVGQLARSKWGDDAYLVGFGTDHGTVAAASEWGGEMEVKQIRPAHELSYEHLCHQSRPDNFFLHLRAPRQKGLRRALMEERLERAIGVIYKPETEMESHYFKAVLPEQFDEYIWFDETNAVTPLKETEAETAGTPDQVPETFPFGL